MGSQKIVKRSVPERQQQVLTVLAHLLHSDQGMQRITTARLAQEVGVSEAALYRYYPSKTAMYSALIDYIENNLTQRIKHVMKFEADTLKRIHDILQMILNFARKNPGMTRILTGHALMFEDSKLQARVGQFFNYLEIQFLNIINMIKVREHREFQIDERLIATHLVSFCEGQFMRYVRHNFKATQLNDFEKHWPLIELILKTK